MLALATALVLAASPPPAGFWRSAHPGQSLAAAVWFDTTATKKALVCVKYDAGGDQSGWVGHLEIGRRKGTALMLMGRGTYCEAFRAASGEEARTVADRPLRTPVRLEVTVADAVSPPNVTFAGATPAKPVLVRRAFSAGTWELCVSATVRRGGPLHLRLRAGTSTSLTFGAQLDMKLKRGCWQAPLEAGGEFAVEVDAPGGGDYLVEMLEFWRME